MQHKFMFMSRSNRIWFNIVPVVLKWKLLSAYFAIFLNSVGMWIVTLGYTLKYNIASIKSCSWMKRCCFCIVHTINLLKFFFYVLGSSSLRRLVILLENLKHFIVIIWSFMFYWELLRQEISICTYIFHYIREKIA